ncbi:enoyl-CoA hydratase/isomerase family protein [Aneurinibacillus tyrosinisolvens]|uniref:enoyl-CoA hydratase/isomerase family protein n=1 Tax=Aneurinibacillus tyrosinisolvens TaxID=1443435 RepID=UPI00063F80A4|nr:enoyl-CoA hydratase/isomerase family protein [Aneurinibacillus tyrosinisolvens]
MSNPSVLYTVQEGIAKIALNLPEMRNPLTSELANELLSFLQEADKDDSIKAIILTGNGSTFCAGGNLNEFKENMSKSVPELYWEGRESTRLFELGATIRTPLIASVNGPAFGGGCGLVAMCHIAIATEQAKFGTTELRLGLVPFVILPWIRRAVGERKAMEMMLTADIFSAEKALEIGLIHRLTTAERLEEDTWQLARTIASYSPLAVKLGIEAFRSTEQNDVATSLAHLNTLRLVSFKSQDLQEGATAFLEKRTPVWEGK